MRSIVASCEELVVRPSLDDSMNCSPGSFSTWSPASFQQPIAHVLLRVGVRDGVLTRFPGNAFVAEPLGHLVQSTATRAEGEAERERW
jgi:hypothetical protein